MKKGRCEQRLQAEIVLLTCLVQFPKGGQYAWLSSKEGTPQTIAAPEKVKEDTCYWQAVTFGTYAHLLDNIPKGKAGILIGYPKAIQKVGKGGQEEIVKNGFQVVDRKPYLGTPKPKRH